MENVDICVSCGNIVPEGTTVCYECMEKLRPIDTREGVYDWLMCVTGQNARWYQRIWLKMYVLSLRYPKKKQYKKT